MDIEYLEKKCFEALNHIDKLHNEARKPYIEQLIKLKTLKSPEPIYINKLTGQWEHPYTKILSQKNDKVK